MPARDWKHERPMNGWGTAALVCGLVALVVGLVPLVGDVAAVPLALAAVGCGARGLMRVEDGLATNPGTAVAGIVLGFVAGLLSVLTLVSILTG